MNVTYLVVVLVAVASILSLRPSSPIVESRRTLSRSSLCLLAVACAIGIVCFALALRLDARAIGVQLRAHPQPLRTWHVWAERVPTPSWMSDAAFAISVVQSVALYVVFRVLRCAKTGWAARAILSVTSATLLWLGLASTTLKSADLYAYAAIARLGFGAYRPPSGALGAGYEAVNYYWGTPVIPDVYGPVWTAVSHALYHDVSGLAGTMLALRWVEVLAFFAIALALRAMNYGVEVIALFATNGALVDQFVRDGHNDLFAIALVLIACAVVRFPFASAVLVAAAIAVKISFVAVGAAAFASITSRRRRLFWFACSAVVGLGWSWLLVGPAYPAAIFEVARRAHENATTQAVHLIALAVVGASVIAIVWDRRANLGSSPAFVALGLLPFPWYLASGLPNAMRSGSPAVFLIALPSAVDLLTSSYAFTPLRAAAFFFIMVVSLLTIVLGVRRRLLIAAFTYGSRS